MLKSELISIGMVTKAQGLNGHISIKPLTDKPAQFLNFKKIFLNNTEYIIEQVQIRHNKIIIKFLNINDRTTAEQLIGLVVQQYYSELQKLDKNEYFIFDIIGLSVKSTSREYIGKITEVLSLPANDVYVVNIDNREILIPAIKNVIKKIDIKQKEMIIEPLDGLLD